MNTLQTLVVYRKGPAWVFDDEAKDIKAEPFVMGIDTMIDMLTKPIRGAKRGFKLTFSENPWPGQQLSLRMLMPGKAKSEGNWYYCPELNQAGWLCSVLYDYFTVAPSTLYVRIDSIEHGFWETLKWWFWKKW